MVGNRLSCITSVTGWPAVDRLRHGGLASDDPLGEVEHLLDGRGRDEHDAVAVGEDEVPGMHGHAGEVPPAPPSPAARCGHGR